MALDKLNSFNAGFNSYNIRPTSESGRVDANSQTSQKKASPDNNNENLKEEKPKKGLDLTITEAPAREFASIENMALSFGSYDSSSISLFGERGLASEDMKQAISGMRRDHILHEYQYFVGGKDLTGKESNIIAGTEDGMVIKLK